LEKKAKEGKLFKRVEIILVNDGSKDGTEGMIKEYTAKHTSD
jgi:glycosyltransferase involved in cell wall biosynthesis